jgi:hypothetical protein
LRAGCKIVAWLSGDGDYTLFMMTAILPVAAARSIKDTNHLPRSSWSSRELSLQRMLAISFPFVKYRLLRSGV